MPITFTYGQLDILRDSPQAPGPLSKLARAESLSTVDKFRVSRLIKEIDSKLGDYGKTLVEIAKKYGEPVKINGRDSYQIKTGASSINLPSIAAVGGGRTIIVTDSGYNVTGHNITIVRNGSDTINHVAGNYVVNTPNGVTVTLVSNALSNNWEID